MTRSRSHLPRRLAACLVVAACVVAGPANAWGVLGHRLVGHLAADELSPAARAEAARLLAGEPEPSLAGVSTWADELRDNNPQLGRRTSRWHYVNLGEHGCTYDASTACRDGDCVVAAITAQTAILADRRRSDAERREALKFVVHFIGDVHQPLHAAYAHDKGGNDVQLQLAAALGSPGQNPGSNLHSLWDSGLLKAMQQDEATHLRRLRAMTLVVPIPRDARVPPAAQWAEASCRAAVSPGFYPATHKLDADYAVRWNSTLDRRLREAGTQLAAVLNATLLSR